MWAEHQAWDPEMKNGGDEVNNTLVCDDLYSYSYLTSQS